MKTFFGIAFSTFIFIFIASCSKSTSTTQTTNGFHFNDVAYMPSYLYSSYNYIFAGTDSPATNTGAVTAVILFSSRPTTSGNYHIVNPNAITPGTGQIGLKLEKNTNGDLRYYPSASTSTDATITVNSNGKLTIAIPNIMLTEYNNGDSANFYGTITQ